MAALSAQHPGQQGHGRGQGQGPGGEIMFTTSQVRSIVASAVAEKEASLCAHYDRILAARLEGGLNQQRSPPPHRGGYTPSCINYK